MHFNPLQVPGDFFPRQPEGSLLTAHLQLVYHERLKSVSDPLILVWPKLREPTIRREKEALKCLSPAQTLTQTKAG